jgi:uncharacterized protein
MPTEERPSRNEEEYFRKRDAELIEAQRAKLDAERAEMERRHRETEREQYYMRCPRCGARLNEQDMQHIKVDVCPGCSGMWLDAGELDILRQTGRQGFSRFLDFVGRKAK